tara:strand:+ start:260 stop:1027 length:768 start_codon:yes stop_codon:yes gene_type:complete
MDWKSRRLLELAGIKRRRTPDHLLREGDEGEEEDPFADEGEEDPFGDEGAEDDGGDGGGGEEDNREPPEELDAKDIEKFGSPRFLDLEMKLKNMFNDAFTSASAAAQHLETYPGEAIEDEPTPAKESEPEDEEANESFYRYGNKRDTWLINESIRLLNEAEGEGSSADEFDMERFCTELANYLDTVSNTEDIESGIFNAARQMVLNNFGTETEQEFIDMLGAVTDGQWNFLPTSMSDPEPETPIALGAGGEGGGA